MVSISKRNKRTSLHQKYKVAKKVRQHHKKAKQVLKKQRPKKDKLTSIPADVPFKAQILKEIENSKAQEKIAEKKRFDNLKKLKNKVVISQLDILKSKLKKNPTKCFVNDIRKLIESSDVLIEVLDARDPNGTRSLDAEREIKLTNKPLVIILNKIDLVPIDNLNSWIKYFSKEAKVFPFKSSCQDDSSLFKAQMKLEKKPKPGYVYGSEAIMTYITSLMSRNDDKIAIGVIGLPNTGKSSVVNSLKKGLVCQVGESPMLTKELKKIDLNSKISIYDSPSIVVSHSNEVFELLERNCINVKSLTDPVEKAKHIFNRCDKKHLSSLYLLSSFANYEQFLTNLAHSLGILKKGGLPQLNEAAKRLINDWNTGRIAHWSKAPETCDHLIELTESQTAAIKLLASKGLKSNDGFSLVESTGPLKTVMNPDDEECDDYESDDEECDGCDDEECDGCDDEECGGCDDEECGGCDDEKCGGCDMDE